MARKGGKGTNLDRLGKRTTHPGRTPALNKAFAKAYRTGEGRPGARNAVQKVVTRQIEKKRPAMAGKAKGKLIAKRTNRYMAGQYGDTG